MTQELMPTWLNGRLDDGDGDGGKEGNGQLPSSGQWPSGHRICKIYLADFDTIASVKYSLADFDRILLSSLFKKSLGDCIWKVHIHKYSPRWILQKKKLSSSRPMTIYDHLNENIKLWLKLLFRFLSNEVISLFSAMPGTQVVTVSHFKPSSFTSLWFPQ